MRMIPPIVMLLPLYFYMNYLGLANTHLGLILAYTVFDILWVVWVLRGFMEAVPPKVEEAAMIDGASQLTYITRILLPLVGPGLAVAGVFAFVTSWNDFAVALILGGTAVRTVPVALSTFVGETVTVWNAIFAIGTLNFIPTIILAFLVRKYWATGLTMGLVK